MGLLKTFDLSKYKTKSFIETGTENGHGIDHVLLYDQFESINSVEINEQFYKSAKNKYQKEDRVKLWLGSSEEKMNEILISIEKYDSCLFWLDAHLPSDPGSKYKHERLTDEIEFPLQKELEIIFNNRDTKNDYFIIDDLRIYIDGPFQYVAKSWPYIEMYPTFFPHSDGIGFIEKLFSKTHNIIKDYRHEGYLLLNPIKND
jgi:hypothetical protein